MDYLYDRKRANQVDTHDISELLNWLVRQTGMVCQSSIVDEAKKRSAIQSFTHLGASHIQCELPVCYSCSISVSADDVQISKKISFVAVTGVHDVVCTLVT